MDRKVEPERNDENVEWVLRYRFWDRVPGGLPENECWEWKGHRDSNGYGRVGGDKRAYFAHRVSAAIHYRFDLESKKVIMHTCDNPPCVNPWHLRIGTHRDNWQDAKKKGRLTRGQITAARRHAKKKAGCRRWW